MRTKDEDDEDGGAESELEDSDSEAELAADQDEEEAAMGQEALKYESRLVVPAALRPCTPNPSTAPSGMRGRQRKSQDKPSEEVGGLAAL